MPGKPTSRRITGIVESGHKKAAFFTTLSWVREQCREKLGFIPYPGTLNMRVAPGLLEKLKKKSSSGRSRLTPPENGYCTAELIPVDIGSIPGAVIILPHEYNIHDEQVIEILAPCNLKEALNLHDSDSLTIVIK